VYAVVFFFRAFASGGFEVGVETLNGVTPQQLDGLNPAIMGFLVSGTVPNLPLTCPKEVTSPESSRPRKQRRGPNSRQCAIESGALTVGAILLNQHGHGRLRSGSDVS